MVMPSLHQALDRDAILRALSSFYGITTADGNLAGTTLICSTLIGSNDFISTKTILLQSGDSIYEHRNATAFDTLTGQITVNPAFSSQVLAGTSFYVLNTAAVDIAPILAALAAIQAAVGDPSADILTSLTAKWGDIARSLDLILGARWDAAGDLGTDIAALLAAVGPVGISQGLCYYGVVTALGGPNEFFIATLAGLGNAKFIDLAGVAPYYAFVLRDASGPGAAPQGEAQPITNYGSATGGFITNPFTAPVAVDDEILIIHPYLARIMNLYGYPPATGNLPANWNSGVATSGNPGADLVTLGAANVKNKVHSLLVDISGLTLAATIRVRLFQLVNGVEREVYNQTFVQGTDPDGLWIINGTVGIHEALRVELHSNNALDDMAVVGYDYMLEAM